MSLKDKGAVEALIEVTRSDCLITNYVNTVGAKASVERLRIGEDLTLHHITVDSDVDMVGSDLRKLSTNVIRVGKNGFWAESRSCSACRFFASSQLVVISTKALKGNKILYRVLLQNPVKLKILEKDLQEAGLNPLILETHLESSEILTEREKEIIKEAYEKGYFDPDRKMSLTEIAKQIDVSPASLSDVLRRGVKKIVKYYLENKL